jgi:hypothetical protein
VGLLIILTKLNIIIVSINVLLLAIDKSELKSPKITILTRITDHSNTLLVPIIISDTINYIYSDVLKVPSEIGNHDASVGFLRVLIVHLSGKSGYMMKSISKYLSKN